MLRAARSVDVLKGFASEVFDLAIVRGHFVAYCHGVLFYNDKVVVFLAFLCEQIFVA